MSVDFDPQRLDRGRRRFEPAVVGAVVVTLAVLAAIAKPWDSAPTPRPAPSQAAVTTTERPPEPTASRPPADPVRIAVTSAVTDHDAWGVTAVLARDPGAPRYTELWTKTSTDASGADNAVVTREGADIAALGITVPMAVQPRAVRIWRLRSDNELEWMDAARIDDQTESRAPLLVRVPLLDGIASVPWAAGQYRVDVLTGDGIHRIAVVVEKQFGDLPGLDDLPISATHAIPASASDPSAIRIGLFATVDGGAVSIPARGSVPLDEEGAWTEDALADRSTVASAYLPRATGLGVMLTSHADVGAATIRRLAPDALVVTPPAIGGISEAQGRTPFVLFPAPDGGVWTPGVYALSVRWTDAAGPHQETWHVDLRPGIG